MLDEKLLNYATPQQRLYVESVNQHGSASKAATHLGIDRKTITQGILRLKAAAAKRGYSPEHDMTRTVPAGFSVKGVSTYYDSEGVARGQWVKSRREDENAQEALRAFVQDLASGIRATSPAIPKPVHSNDDLLAVYPCGDPHFGMYAWAEEAGDDFDLDKAESLACAAVDRLVASAPNAKTALLLNLGDMFHADNQTNRTPESGHSLDVDTRHAKVMQVAFRAKVYCLQRLAEKHESVVDWNMPGNHDPNTSFALSLCLSAYFENNPRIKIDLSPGLYKYLRFGKVLIGSHHGHGAKPGELPLIMATDRKVDWGETDHRYWYCGHIHHWTGKEHPGVIVETFRTLAPRDAWHAGKGYRAGRDMQLIVHHREFGEIERHRCDIAMLEAA